MDEVRSLDIDVLNGSIRPLAKVSDPGDDKLWVTFKSASHFDDVATRDKGRPVFEMRDYIQIIVPGDSTTVIEREVRETDKERFPKQWLAYKAGREQVQGTPLSTWNQITKAQVEELAFFRIQTVEQLAGVSDAVTQKFMGLNQLRDKAKLYLEQLKGEEPMLKLQAEIAQRDEREKALLAQMEEMREAIASLQAQRAEAHSDEEVPEPRPRVRRA